MSKPDTLLFIYNAESGLANALLDYGKKYVAPSKYDCQLCMLSYGPFGIKQDWKKFTKELPYNVKFLHKDELNAQYPDVKTTFPAVVRIQNNTSKTLLNGKDFKAIQSLDELKSAVMKALEE